MIRSRLAPFTPYGWAIAGHGAAAIAQYTVLIALAKSLTPESVGIFTFALAVNAPIVTVASLQLRQLAASDAQRLVDTRQYASLRLKSTLAAIAALPLIYLLIGLSGLALIVTALVAAARLAEQHTDLAYGFLARENEQAAVAKSQFIRAGAMCIVLPLLTHATGSIVIAALVYAASYLGTYLLVDARRDPPSRVTRTGIAHIRGMLSIPVPRQLLAAAVPLTLAALGASLLFAVPRYFCEAGVGLDAVAYFSACAQLPLAAYIVMNAMGQCLSPHLAQSHISNPARFRSLVLYWAAGCLAAAALGVLFAAAYGHILLGLIFTQAYAPYAKVLTVLSAATGFGLISSVFGYAATAARIYRPQTVVTLGSLALLCLLCAFRQTTLVSLSENVLVTSIAQCIALGLLTFKYTASSLEDHRQASVPSVFRGGELRP